MAAFTTSGLDQFLAPADTTVRPGKGLLSRFFAAVSRARMLQAERQIAQLIEAKGGRMTDDLERQIERNFI
jgi:hypothetical protein